jgi:hypothetical protein
MLFKLLKLCGLDVPAKIAAAKAELEHRVEDFTDYAKQATQTAAIVATLSAVAALSLTVAAGVGLFAFYRVIAENYGTYAGLGMVAGLLVAAALALLFVARAKAQTFSDLRIFSRSSDPALSPAQETSAAAPVLAPPSPGAFAAESNETANDLFEPLAFVFAKYVRFPELGNPVLDQFVGSLRASARGTADDALRRAATLIRHGDRTQLLAMIGGAAFVGWVLARQNSEAPLRDITPVGRDRDGVVVAPLL